MAITKTVTDQYISLTCKVPKSIYQVNSILRVQFSVVNISSDTVYLITANPEDMHFSTYMKDKNDSILNKDMYIEVNKFQIYEEYFEMPPIIKLASGEEYTDNADFKLVNYTPRGKFSVYLTVFYMSEEKKSEFDRMLNALGPKAGADFPYSLVKLTSSPIKLSIAE